MMTKPEELNLNFNSTKKHYHHYLDTYKKNEKHPWQMPPNSQQPNNHQLKLPNPTQTSKYHNFFKNNTQTLKTTHMQTPLPIIAELHPNFQQLNNDPPETLQLHSNQQKPQIVINTDT